MTENMESWASFWGVVLILTMAIFAILAIVVSIGGFFDVRALFQRMDEQHREQGNVKQDDRK